MTEFVFIRHAEPDFSRRGTLIYRGWGECMATLSEKGEAQARSLAEDAAVQGADTILTSPYSRALHSAAILSRALDLPLTVEPLLHEWCADRNYAYLTQEEADARYADFLAHDGVAPAEGCEWESIADVQRRVDSVLARYTEYKKVLVVCHGMLMQYYFGIDHPEHTEYRAIMK